MDIQQSVSSELEEKYTFYYPCACRSADGHLSAATSSYAEPGRHYSGSAIITADNPDYDLWLWIVARLESVECGRIGDKDRELYRTEFEKEREQSPSAAAFREQLLAAVPVCPKLALSKRLKEAVCTIIAAPFVVLGLLFVFGPNIKPIHLWDKLTARLRAKH